MEDTLRYSAVSLSRARALFRHVLCHWSWSSSLINKTFIHAWVSVVNIVARNPPPLSANWHFRSASILLVMPQLPMIQSILEGRNQVPPSHFRCRFTRIFIGSTWHHSVSSPSFLCPSHSCATCQSVVTAATTTRGRSTKHSQKVYNKATICPGSGAILGCF